MNNYKSNDTLQKVSDWLPLVLITGGILLVRLGFEYGGLIMNIGFLCYGVLGFIDLARKGYHNNGVSLKLLKIVLQVVVAILALVNIFLTDTFLPMLMIVLLDKLLLASGKLDSVDASK